jgi:hypothetical protein
VTGNISSPEAISGWPASLHQPGRAARAAPSKVSRSVSPAVTGEGNPPVDRTRYLKVELRDSSGKPIENYSFAQCTPITGDAVSIPATWGQRKTIAPAAGQNLRLAFELKNAKLYSFWTEGDAGGGMHAPQGRSSATTIHTSAPAFPARAAPVIFSG